MCVPCFLFVFAEAFVQTLLGAISLCILVRVLLTWIPVRLPLGIGDLVFTVSETILAPIRRVLPFMGGLDLSPLVAILAINYVIAPLVVEIFRRLPYPI